jgi:excisionase family DNA binding protein
LTEFMTLEEMANYLRVTKKTIYRLLEKQRIPALKIGHQWRFDKISVDGWLRQKNLIGTVNVLVIDDEELVCLLFKDTLEEAGHTVTMCTKSADGLALVRERDFDLVFLDLKMPLMDGAELFREIKTIKPNLPVTIITGYPDSDLMTKALNYGPFGVMRKPFRGSDILAAVSYYLYFGTASR